MRRIVFLSGAVSFAMVFLGTLVASTLAVPAVGASARSIVGDNGADRINLGTRPGLNASVGVRDANGIRRASFNTGMLAGSDAPDSAGFTVWAIHGTTGLASLRNGGRKANPLRPGSPSGIGRGRSGSGCR